MGRFRNRVWVLFKQERENPRIVPRVRYRVQSKITWQKAVEWERKKGPTLQSLYKVANTFLAESEDKESLEQMKALIEEKEDG